MSEQLPIVIIGAGAFGSHQIAEAAIDHYEGQPTPFMHETVEAMNAMSDAMLLGGVACVGIVLASQLGGLFRSRRRG